MSTRVSWWLLNAELLLGINAAQAIMPLFCLSIGLTQGEIGVREAICSLVYLLFNIPTGWLADRVNRRLCNFIGDTCYGTALIVLSLSASFMSATVAGMIMAFGNACSQGADEALIKAHCDDLGKDYIDIRKRLSQTSSWFSLGYYLIGGILTALLGMKTTILIAAIPFFVAAIASCFIKELGIHKEMTTKQISFKTTAFEELKGLSEAIRFALRENSKLPWLMAISAIATVMGGPMMGLVGPIILAAGGSEGIVGASHIAISLASICGGWLSRTVFKTWQPQRLFIVMSSISLTIMVVTSVHFNPWTAGLHIVVVQVIRVLLMTSLGPLIQKAAPGDIQSTIASLRHTISESLYVVIVLVINFAANHGVQWGIAANFLLFAPLVAIATRAHYKRNKSS